MIPFGRYNLLRRLAVGGMSELFVARRGDEPTGPLLVVKRILPHLQAEEDYVQMFLDEARLSSRFRHPNVLQVHDWGVAEGIHFIVLDRIDGLSLSRLQRAQGRRQLSLELACWLCAEACAGLAYVHEQTGADGQPLGIVHRDISPDNILLSRDGEVKVADFGIAKATLQLRRTRPGQLKGKLVYMSPEQGTMEDVDHRSDIFSIGLVLYELTVGRRVFDAPTRAGVLRALAAGHHRAPSELVADYPAALQAVVERALTWDRAARYQRAAEMEQALRALHLGDGRLPPQHRSLAELVERHAGPPTDFAPDPERRTEV